MQPHKPLSRTDKLALIAALLFLCVIWYAAHSAGVRFDWGSAR